MRMNTEILYTPLDIELVLPNEQKIIDWVVDHRIKDTDYNQYQINWNIHCPVVSCFPIEDWTSSDSIVELDKHIHKLHNTGKRYWHPGFKETFPEIAAAIEAMPFEELTVAIIQTQIGYIEPHKDDLDDRASTIEEPRRFFIHLTNPTESSLFLCKEKEGERVYPKLNPSWPCYAFNNDTVHHGAEKKDRVRLIINTAGIIDPVKHKELIDRSIKKFKDEVLYVDL
jgi:hypothetical protein